MGAGCCGSKAKVVAPQPHRTDEAPAPKPQPKKQPTTPRKPGNISRALKCGVTATDPLQFIDGYLHEPLLPLEDALYPLHNEIDDLSHHIHEAKARCHYPSQHGLTRDESAAIYIYTMQWEHTCVYDHLETSWKSRNRERMKPWFKYLKLLRTALNKLPDVRHAVWQGVPFDEILTEKISSKTIPLYCSMGFCLPTSNEIEEALEKSHYDKKILVSYTFVRGKSISEYSEHPCNEVILWPGVKIALVNSNTMDAHGSIIFHLSGNRK